MSTSRVRWVQTIIRQFRDIHDRILATREFHIIRDSPETISHPPFTPAASLRQAALFNGENAFDVILTLEIVLKGAWDFLEGAVAVRHQ